MNQEYFSTNMASSAILVVFALACSAVTCFSVQDYVASLDTQEAFDLLTGLPSSDKRVAREIDYKFPPKCCGHEGVKFSDTDKEAYEACRVAPHEDDEEERDAGIDKQLRGLSCWMECMGKNKTALDKDGFVILEEFKAHYKTMYADADLHDLTDKAISTCVAAANAKAKEVGPEKIDGKECNRATAYTVMCIRYKIETECPNADKVDSVDCTKIRAYLKEWNKKTGLKYN
uniref:Chemosensory protein n=1 Tax=Blattella germanica TaxID=6973 RepID=A0A0X8DF85_BLAGE|nr:chemosensory protein [Blattella germanica]